MTFHTSFTQMFQNSSKTGSTKMTFFITPSIEIYVGSPKNFKTLLQRYQHFISLK